MARTLAELTDAELEAQFLEAEHNALAWAELDVGVHAQHRGARWMAIAAELQAEIARRARLPPAPLRARRSKRRRRPGA